MEPLETTTESLCDQLKKFVAKQMEKERLKEIEIEKRSKEGDNFLPILGYIGLGALTLIALGLTSWLFYNLWLDRKSKQAGPITRTPKTPIDESKLWIYEARYQKLNEVRILYLPYQESVCYIGEMWQLSRIINMALNLTYSVYELPVATRIVLIKMEGFRYGAKCHDFEPIDGGVPDGYYTYQMYGDDKIQVTRYVVGNQSFVAGLCIYTENRDVWGVEISEKVIKRMLKSTKYPGKDAVGNAVEEKVEEPKSSKDSVKVSVLARVLGFFKSNETEKKEKTNEDKPPTYSSLSMV